MVVDDEVGVSISGNDFKLKLWGGIKKRGKS